MKQKIFLLLNEDRRVMEFINGLIILNVIVLILESYKDINADHGPFFYWFEVFTVFIFTIEYILRIWTADVDPRYDGNSIKDRLRFIFSPLGLIDLVAIIPFYLPLLITLDLRVVRILRVMRLLRIFKLGRYSKSLKTIQKVLSSTKSDLAMSLFITFILLTISSTMMYYIEGDIQPDKFPNIGQSFWWAIATLTTVGYGDVYPVTNGGKILSAVIVVIGIGLVALPTAIISSQFIEELHKNRPPKSKECICPKCGNRFLETD